MNSNAALKLQIDYYETNSMRLAIVVTKMILEQCEINSGFRVKQNK